MQGFFNPELLQGDGTIVDKEGGKVIKIDDIKMWLREYMEAFIFIADWEKGMFSMTMNEYLTMPETLVITIREYRSARAEAAKAQTERD